MTHTISRCIVALAALAILSGTAWPQGETEPARPAAHFEITRFDVRGNTLLPGARVDRVLAPFAGRERDFGAVQKAVAALQAAYRKKGYRLVRVVLPEQTLDHGEVRIDVIERRIGKIIVTGNKHFSEANIRRSVPGLREGASPNLADIAASLKVASENPAKSTTLQLEAADQGGEVNADIKVVDSKPWLASIGIDDTGDARTGRNRVTAEYQNADIGGIDHVLGLEYTTSLSHPDDVSVLGAAYHIPLYAIGDSLDFYANYSNVDSGLVSAGVFNLAVSGKGTVAGMRYNHTLPRLGDYESKLIGGFDYKAFQDDIGLAGVQLGNDVTVRPLSLTYAGAWAAAGNTVNFYLSESRNIPGGDNGSDADFETARTDASANYSILRYGASYVRSLPADWQIRLALNGQSSRDALVLGEQFGVGGASSVRGFDERELADDQGRTANAELYTPNLCAGAAQCRFLGFYDNGHVSRNDPLPGEISHESISSTGLGWRMTYDRYVSLQVDYAQVLDGTETSPSGSHRIHFRALFTY